MYWHPTLKDLLSPLLPSENKTPLSCSSESHLSSRQSSSFFLPSFCFGLCLHSSVKKPHSLGNVLIVFRGLLRELMHMHAGFPVTQNQEFCHFVESRDEAQVLGPFTNGSTYSSRVETSLIPQLFLFLVIPHILVRKLLHILFNFFLSHYISFPLGAL